MEEPKRQDPRVKPSRVLVRIATAEALRAHYLKDLSEGGLFLRVDKPLPVGSEVVLELVPPGWGTSLPLSGRVVRVANDDAARAAGAVGMAVQFENLSADVEQRLAGLVEEHRSPAAPSEGASEVDRLRMQIQGLVFELGAAREAQQAGESQHEDERQELLAARAQNEALTHAQDELVARCESLKAELALRDAQPREAPGAAADLEVALAEVETLRTDLAEAQVQVEALKQDAATLEQDEANSRALSEQFANEKGEVERLRQEEGERAAGEIERLQAEQAQTATKLEAAQAKVKDLDLALSAERSARRAIEETAAQEHRARATAEGRADALQKQLTEATGARTAASEGKLRAAAQQLDAERARTAKVEQRLVEAQAQLERAKSKERDLRRLLSLVSNKTGGDAVVVVEDEPAPQAAEPEAMAVELDSQPEPELEAQAVDLDSQPELEAQAVDVDAQPEPELELEAQAIEVDASPELSDAPAPEAVAASGDLVEQLFGSEPIAPPEGEAAGEGVDSSWDSVPEVGAPAQPIDGGWDMAVPPEGEAAWTDVPAEGSVVYEAVPGEMAASELAPSEVELSEPELVPEGAMPDLDADAVEVEEELAQAEPEAPASMPEDWAALDLSEVPNAASLPPNEPLPFDTENEAPAPAQRLEAAEFERRVRGGARVVRTQRFYLHTSTDTAEVMVNSWLEDGDTLLALVRLAKGRLTADRITRVLYTHYTADLVDLATPAA